ncbi:hypothetical protein [Leisingera sp.]|uniref:hypothetical protein n=1 Tax=Leisingera sp. TaxID=1879318 RepID=UPI002B27A115|nr:hypothetical protein [Leisingera sp.]
MFADVCNRARWKFGRYTEAGLVTSSAFVMSPDTTCVLLTRHWKLASGCNWAVIATALPTFSENKTMKNAGIAGQAAV